MFNQYQNQQQQQQPMEEELPLCNCGNPMLKRQCQNDKNPGRWYYACPLKGAQQCKGVGAFKWADQAAPQRKKVSAPRRQQPSQPLPQVQSIYVEEPSSPQQNNIPADTQGALEEIARRERLLTLELLRDRITEIENNHRLILQKLDIIIANTSMPQELPPTPQHSPVHL
jgi:hypothetical protein